MTEKVIQGLLAATGALNETLRLVQAVGTESEFKDFRKQTATVMAAIYLDMIKPIVQDYPDLDPGLEPGADS
ncbi:MAG: hypothetical protein WBC51_24610 [Vicinamibacterales bacterium]